MTGRNSASELLRDTPLATFCRWASGGRLFKWQEEKDDFDLVEMLLRSREAAKQQETASTPETDFEADEKTIGLESELTKREKKNPDAEDALTSCETVAVPDRESARAEILSMIQTGQDLYITWYGPEDSVNPQNWTRGKKLLNLFALDALTIVAYAAASWYTPAVQGVQDEFGVSYTQAILGLSLYVLGYGTGPMLIAPMSENPKYGRNAMYVITHFLFLICQGFATWAPNYGVLMVMRFLTGFLATSITITASSVIEMYDDEHMTYALLSWDMVTVIGPAIGPLVGGFAAQYSTWRWTMRQILMSMGFAFIMFVIFGNETYPPNLLKRRVDRLRRRLGRENVYVLGDKPAETETEAGTEAEEAGSEARGEPKVEQKGDAKVNSNTIMRPIRLFFEPILLFSNLYLGLVYGLFYLWFEAVPIAFTAAYGFTLSQQGMTYLSTTVGCYICTLFYLIFLFKCLKPKLRNNVPFEAEYRLVPAIYFSIALSASLFVFGWTARPSVHWIVPVIAMGVYAGCLMILFQCFFVYLPLIYPQFTASVYSTNSVVRASMGLAFPLFGHILFERLGVDVGCSMLGGISILLSLILFVMVFKYGKPLREKSKYAA